MIQATVTDRDVAKPEVPAVFYQRIVGASIVKVADENRGEEAVL